jgi:hypothetical protein
MARCVRPRPRESFGPFLLIPALEVGALSHPVRRVSCMEIAAATGVREVMALVDHAARVLAGYDPAVVMASDAMKLVKLFDQIERFGCAGKTLSIGRVAQTGLCRQAGFRSPADWMADATDVGIGDAVRFVETAKALEHAEATAEAFKAGELSPRQAQVIAATAAVAPEMEARVGRQGQTSGPCQVRGVGCRAGVTVALEACTAHLDRGRTRLRAVESPTRRPRPDHGGDQRGEGPDLQRCPSGRRSRISGGVHR